MYLFPDGSLVMLVLRLPSLSRPPGETLAPEDIEMDSMTFSMEDVSSEDLKVLSTFVSRCIDLQVISCHIGLKDVYIYIYIHICMYMFFTNWIHLKNIYIDIHFFEQILMNF